MVELAHGFAHPHRCDHSPVGRRECGHHRIADGFHDSTRLGSHDLIEDTEMGFHQVKRCKVADPFVECCRATEVGEEEGKLVIFNR